LTAKLYINLFKYLTLIRIFIHSSILIILKFKITNPADLML